MGGRRSPLRGSLHSGAVAALLTVGLGTSAARAEAPTPPATEPFRMMWSSSAGCGAASTFLTELRSRTSRLRPARDGERATTLILEMFATSSGVRGQLTVRKADGELSTREVPGRDCQEVESAMALIAALMVDPLASTSELALASRPPAEPPPIELSPATSKQSRWTIRVEPRLTARTAVGPGLTWGEALGASLTWQSNSLHPSLQLTAQRAKTTASSPAGSAELEWTAGELLACPWAAQPSSSLELRACALLQLGRLRGSGYDTISPATESIFWSAAGVALQGRVQLLGPLWLGIDGGLERPFTRERFYVDPSHTLHQVPAWGGSLGFGVGVLFF